MAGVLGSWSYLVDRMCRSRHWRMAQFYHAAALCNKSLHEKHVLDIEEVQDVLETFMWPSDLADVPRDSVEEAAPFGDVLPARGASPPGEDCQWCGRSHSHEFDNGVDGQPGELARLDALLAAKWQRADARGRLSMDGGWNYEHEEGEPRSWQTRTESGIWVSRGPTSDEAEPFEIRFPPTVRTNVPLQVGNEAVDERGYASFAPMLAEVAFLRSLCEGVLGMPRAEGRLDKAIRDAPPTCMLVEVWVKAIEEAVEIVLDLARGPIVLWVLASKHVVFAWAPDVWSLDRAIPHPRFYFIEEREGPAEMWIIALQVLFALESSTHAVLAHRRVTAAGQPSVLRACAARVVPDSLPNEGQDDDDDDGVPRWSEDAELHGMELDLYREERDLAADEARIARGRNRGAASTAAEAGSSYGEDCNDAPDERVDTLDGGVDADGEAHDDQTVGASAAAEAASSTKKKKKRSGKRREGRAWREWRAREDAAPSSWDERQDDAEEEEQQPSPPLPPAQAPKWRPKAKAAPPKAAPPKSAPARAPLFKAPPVPQAPRPEREVCCHPQCNRRIDNP